MIHIIDAGEVTLDKLQADQIFIGMISMRELPKLHTNNFVDVLREAGVSANKCGGGEGREGGGGGGGG